MPLQTRTTKSGGTRQLLFYVSLVAIWAGGLGYFKDSTLGSVVWTIVIAVWVSYDLVHEKRRKSGVPNRPRTISHTQAVAETTFYLALIGFGWFWGIVAIWWGWHVEHQAFRITPWMLPFMIVWTGLIYWWIAREVRRVWRDYNRGLLSPDPPGISQAEATQGDRQRTQVGSEALNKGE